MPNTRNWPIRSAHSMTIGGKHTFRDWYMVAEAIPVFQPPSPRENLVEVPGMSGVLDYSDVLTGTPTYGNRTGSFSFIVMDGGNWTSIYHTVLNFLHGQKLNCILDDEPDYFYTGRFSVNEQESKKEYSRIVIDYNVDPYKYPIDHTLSHDWLWNDLFSNVIYYGIFDVSGTVARNLINPSGSSITPKFTCSSAMTVTKGGSTYSLPAGTTTSPGFSLSPGDNQMTFAGNGRVEVDYSLGNKEL